MDSLDVKELQNFQDCSNLRLLLWARIVLFPSLWILTPESFRGISLADTVELECSLVFGFTFQGVYLIFLVSFESMLFPSSKFSYT
jgi:hypothetical protein